MHIHCTVTTLKYIILNILKNTYRFDIGLRKLTF